MSQQQKLSKNTTLLTTKELYVDSFSWSKTTSLLKNKMIFHTTNAIAWSQWNELALRIFMVVEKLLQALIRLLASIATH